jgi:hypothetical protein
VLLNVLKGIIPDKYIINGRGNRDGTGYSGRCEKKICAGYYKESELLWYWGM